MVINGERVNIVSCKEKLKARQYERIISEWGVDLPVDDRDHFKLFCILADKEFKGFVPNVNNEQHIWDGIRWVYEQGIDFSKEFPSVLQVGDKVIELPKKITALCIGQNIAMKQLISQAKYLEECISMAVSIFIQPLYDNDKFDLTKARMLNLMIQEMPAYLIYPVGFFFAQESFRAWNAFSEVQQPDPKQPKALFKQNVAKLAGVHKLAPYADINIIKQYAKMFGMNPDTVYTDVSFDTVTLILNSEKIADEYAERFNAIYQELHADPITNNRTGKQGGRD